MLSNDERAELTRGLARLEMTLPMSRDAARPASLDQTSVGRLSRMDTLQNRQMSAGLHSRNAARHEQILDALARMDGDMYGTCSHCGQPVPYGRLLVFPEARSWAACGAKGG